MRPGSLTALLQPTADVRLSAQRRVARSEPNAAAAIASARPVRRTSSAASMENSSAWRKTPTGRLSEAQEILAHALRTVGGGQYRVVRSIDHVVALGS